MKIYTKAGDSGLASTINRRMVPKNAPIFSLLGTLDELNSVLGLARSILSGETVGVVQALQADIIALSTEFAGGEKFATDARVANMENSIDAIMAATTRTEGFVTPGDSKGGAALDVARTVARRAERELSASKQTGGVTRAAMAYLNRVSDFLYALARLADSQEPRGAENLSASFERQSLESPAQNGAGQNLESAAPCGANSYSGAARALPKAAGESAILEAGLWLCGEVLNKALADGLPVVTAACDSGGNLVALLRANGAYIASIDIAVNKAFTSVSLQMPTEELAPLCQPGCPLYGIQNTNQNRIVIFGGGIPLCLNGVLSGGFGVSGGSAEQDTALAHYANEIFKKQFA